MKLAAVPSAMATMLAALLIVAPGLVGCSKTLPDGVKYTGEWYGGTRNVEWAFLRYSDGRSYRGEFWDGKFNGQGTYTRDRYKYTGAFEDGKFNGQGTATWADGNTFTGEWKDGVPNGYGTLMYADGATYTDEYKDGKPSGQVTMKYPNGDIYTGDFLFGVPTRQGTMKYANGSTYTGEWKAGLFDGQGTYTFPNGFSFTGKNVADLLTLQPTIPTITPSPTATLLPSFFTATQAEINKTSTMVAYKYSFTATREWVLTQEWLYGTATQPVTPTALPLPTATALPVPTATALPVPTATVEPSPTPVPVQVAPVAPSAGSGGGSNLPVKKSRRDICHAPGTRWYDETVNYTSYNTLQECLDSGGRMPRG